jgi:hypothetical protein
MQPIKNSTPTQSLDACWKQIAESSKDPIAKTIALEILAHLANRPVHNNKSDNYPYHAIREIWEKHAPQLKRAEPDTPLKGFLIQPFRTNFSLHSEPESIERMLPDDLLTVICKQFIADTPSWRAVVDLALTCKQFALQLFTNEITQFFLSQRSVDELGLTRPQACLLAAKYCSPSANLSLKFKDFSLDPIDKYAPFLLERSFSHFAYVDNALNNTPSSSFINDSRLLKLLSHSPKLKTLSLRGCKQLSNHFFVGLTTFCPDLTTIRLKDLTAIDTISFIALASMRTQLKCLSLIMQMPPRQRAAAATAATATTTEHPAAGNSCFSTEGFNFLALMSKRLKKLSLAHANLTDQSIVNLASYCSKTLKKVHLLNPGPITQASIQALLKCQSMSSFHLSASAITIGNHLAKKIADSWPQLTQLAVDCSQDLSHIGLGALAAKCSTLSALSLDGHCATAESLQTICQMSALTKLSFDKKCQWPQEGAAPLINNLSENKTIALRELVLNSSNVKFDIPQLRKLAARFPNLFFISSRASVPIEASNTIQEEFPDFHFYFK